MQTRGLRVAFVCLTFAAFTSNAFGSREPSANVINTHSPSSETLDWSVAATESTDDNDVITDGDSSEDRQTGRPSEDRVERRGNWRMIGRRSLVVADGGPSDVIVTTSGASRKRRASSHQSFFVRIGRGPGDDNRSGARRRRRSHVTSSDRSFDGSDDGWSTYDQNDDVVKRGTSSGDDAGLDFSDESTTDPEDGFDKRGPNSFIRLGRSQKDLGDRYEKRGPNSFIRLGRSHTGAEDVVKRGPNSFIRLGRSRGRAGNRDALKQAVSQHELEMKRGPNTFIRLGRSRHLLADNEDLLEQQQQRAGEDGIAKRGPNSFIRLGRSRDVHSDVVLDVDTKRGPNSFIRLGKSYNPVPADNNLTATSFATMEDRASNRHRTRPAGGVPLSDSVLPVSEAMKESDEAGLQYEITNNDGMSPTNEKRGPSSFIKLGKRSTNEDH